MLLSVNIYEIIDIILKNSVMINKSHQLGTALQLGNFLQVHEYQSNNIDSKAFRVNLEKKSKFQIGSAGNRTRDFLSSAHSANHCFVDII